MMFRRRDGVDERIARLRGEMESRIDQLVESKFKEIAQLIDYRAEEKLNEVLRVREQFFYASLANFARYIQDVNRGILTLKQALGENSDEKTVEAMDKLSDAVQSGLSMLSEVATLLAEGEKFARMLRSSRDWLGGALHQAEELRKRTNELDDRLDRIEARFSSVKEDLKRELVRDVLDSVLAEFMKGGLLDYITRRAVDATLAELARLGRIKARKEGRIEDRLTRAKRKAKEKEKEEEES